VAQHTSSSVSTGSLLFLIFCVLLLAVAAFSFLADIYNGSKSDHPSAADHLKLAKEICEVKSDGKVFCVAKPEAAIGELNQIPASTPEYKEAARLLPILHAHAKEEAEAEREASAAANAKAEADKLRLANQTQDESLAQLIRNIGGEAHDPFICRNGVNNLHDVSFDNGHYWWIDDGRCAKQEENKQRIREQAEMEKHQHEQRRRDQEAELSSYWPTTLRVDTDMDSFWLNKEERTCQTLPDEKGRVSAVNCNSSESHKNHNIPVRFWGGVDRNAVSNWKCTREGDDFVCRAID